MDWSRLIHNGLVGTRFTKDCPRLISIGLAETREFARRFAEGIRKLVGNTLGDYRKKTIRLTSRMLAVVGLAGGLVFIQRRLIVDAGVPHRGGLGSGRMSIVVEPL
ncbi:hypothetical protein B296_00006134 [Ensete ventricosum]|uniref:Uncharacterized protein n=1 Tax=Ensete ventricosum TaxID=4639 RepID=A0A427AUH3_ENSVE|nr:hypothetical protein B296_00006134 [Ensete ventricosum]